MNRRRTVLLLQSLMVIEGLTLGILTLLHLVTVYWVIGLAIFFGILSAFEVPTRQALIADIVPRKDLLNAIALGSSAFNVARVIGPAIAGVLISTVGIAACFLINAASYLAVIASLIIMKTDTPPVRLDSARRVKRCARASDTSAITHGPVRSSPSSLPSRSSASRS